MNYWIHRISHLAELSYPLLHKGFLTIGFSDFTSDETIRKSRKGDWNYFNGQFEEKWGAVPRTRHNLWNFLNMAKGDIVVVPSLGTFFVCQIEGEEPIKIGDTFSEDLKTWGGQAVSKNGDFLVTEKGTTIDLGFAWKVKVLHKHISRDKFADAKLTARMKIRQTNASINDLKSSVEKSIRNYENNKPIHLHSILIDKTATLVLDTIKNELNPDKFEKLVKTYFTSIGANSVTIPAKNERDKEGDADIVAVFEHIKLIIYAQVKFQKGQISEWGAMQINEYKTSKERLDDGYNKVAWVITTANTFNEKAENLAKHHAIQLINGLEFSKMILNSGIDLLHKEL